jgi:hypothetical protein
MANTKGLNEILPLQVAKGHVVEYQGQVFGDRGTLQVRRGGLHRVKGKYGSTRRRCPTWESSRSLDAGDQPEREGSRSIAASSTAWINASFVPRTRPNSGTSLGRPREIWWKSAFQRSRPSPLAGSTPKRIRYFRPPIRVSSPTLGSTRPEFELESVAPARRVSLSAPPVLRPDAAV